MHSLLELTSRIWTEFVTMQLGQVPLSNSHKGLPSMIPAGGKSLIISDQMARDINNFARIFHDSSPELKIAYGSKSIIDLVQKAFGTALARSDLDIEQESAVKQLFESVCRFLEADVTKGKPARTLIFGCWLIREEVAGDLSFGPVRFQRRDLWLDHVHANGRLSTLIHRRIRRKWDGAKLRPLQRDLDKWREEAVLTAIGECPMVCSVETNGLAPDAAYDKAVLAIRLAMTAISLLWDRPSQALKGFGLLIEGGSLKQHHIVFGPAGAMSSSSNWSRRVGSTWVAAEEWPGIWNDSGWINTPVSELLSSLLNPTQSPARPQISRSLLHALWWLYEGCCAEAPLMAAAKFGACLDILAGGKSEGRILRLLKARFGTGPDDPITADGRTARIVVKSIYGAARSRTLHGSNERYDHDWRGIRDLAEHLTRMCFVEVLGWLADNPQAIDLSGALKEAHQV